MDDASQRLLSHVLVPVDDHVQTFVDRAQSRRDQGFDVGAALAFHLDVLSSRDRPFLQHHLSIRLQLSLVRVGKGSVGTSSDD